MWNLGDLYAIGYGVEENLDRALDWFNKAESDCLIPGDREERISRKKKDLIGVKGDERAAMYTLGTVYYRDKDYERVSGWYRKAVEKGHAGAMQTLGIMYCSPIGVGKDRERGKKWFQRALEAGSE